jgi:DNA mismatch repair protein MutS2
MTHSTSPDLDLDLASRRALEFDELLAWVASFARTPIGAERITSVAPSADAETIRSRLAAVDEMRACLEEGGGVVPGRLPDPGQAAGALRVEGVTLDGKAVRDLALVLESARSVRARLRGLAADASPHLRRLGDAIPDLRAEVEAVLRGTDGEGRLLDDASPELRRLRDRAAHVGDKLRRMLQRHLRDPRSEAVIRDDFVTQRNGRFVIPVRTDAPRAVRGIVHASSSTGATRFIEPIESVELNNELVRLVEDEREEQERILAAWSEAFRRRRDDVDHALAAVARADSLQARCLYADACGAATPQLSPGAALRLEGLRHPLLQRRLNEEGGECVASTLELSPADQVLVLSGPNTGGKTVALKAVGLAVVAAQSGIPLPAGAAELPVYRQVRADIGDHQSIQADLSTYSAHVRAVAAAVRAPAPPALFLFDEIGTGTEPTEGGALARAILESLARPGITTVATTHLGPVKAWAVTAERAACAAMDFDPDSLSPTYRIVMGAAGRSAGLDIAERLGLAEAVVRRARSLLDPRVREAESYLRRLRDALAEAETRAEQVRSEREELAEARRRWKGRREREGEARRREAERALSQALEEFRRAARKEIASLRDPEQRARAERRRRRAERRLGAQRARQRAAIVRPSEAPRGGRPVVGERLAPGERVWVSGLEREGELQAVEGREATVRMGQVVCRVLVADLRLPVEGDGPRGREDAASRVAATSAAGAALEGRSCPRELVLVGRRVAEALDDLDRFLDAARLAGHEEIRVVHGHGTGRLRAAVREFLADHDQVRAHRPGGPAEGGDAATVVKLL